MGGAQCHSFFPPSINTTLFDSVDVTMNSSSQVPLSDVLPWGDTVPTHGRTILINDSAETDGRFLLYTLASQCLITRKNNALGGAAAFTAGRRVPSLVHNSASSNALSSSNISSSSHKGNVLWVSCNAVTNHQIMSASNSDTNTKFK